MEEKELFVNEFDREFGDSYRESQSSATNPDHQLPGNSESESGQSSASEAGKELAAQVKPKDFGAIEVMGYDAQDIINTMLPKGAPDGSRHKFALKLYYDLLILLDGDHDRARHVLEQQKCSRERK